MTLHFAGVWELGSSPSTDIGDLYGSPTAFAIHSLAGFLSRSLSGLLISAGAFRLVRGAHLTKNGGQRIPIALLIQSVDSTLQMYKIELIPKVKAYFLSLIAA